MLKSISTIATALVLNNGTANSLLFLNASKTATTSANLTFDGTNFFIGSSTAGANIRLRSSSDGNNGLFRFFDQNGTRRGDFYAFGANGLYLVTAGGDVPLILGTNDQERIRLTASGLGIGGASFGGGTGAIVFIANAATVPTTNPSDGGVMYSEGGALKWRGSSGTVTTIANA